MKSRTVTIIDYGMGNVRSLYNAFNYLGAKVKISEDVKTVSKSNIAILPGVGSFNKAMKVIKKNSLDSAIKEIISRGDFLFCICLGMQLLAKSSNEEKYTKGLQIIPNKVKKFSSKETNNKIPHVGFNQVFFEKKNKLFSNLSSGTDFYFVHTYAFMPEEKVEIIATANYSIPVTAIVNKGNIWGTQFHPEKSSKAGLRIIKNFLEYI